MTQQVNRRPTKCQSRLWSQRGTKVNGSHHGDNPLLRPTGIQIATKSYETLQAMAPTRMALKRAAYTRYLSGDITGPDIVRINIIGTGWNWNSGNNRVRCSPDWSVYRCIERYCMTPRQRDDDNNLSVGNRNHLKLGIEPESWLQSHELGF